MRDYDHDLCRRCMVYRSAHAEGRGCGYFVGRANPIKVWLHHHDPIRHIRGWVWWRFTTERLRWRIADRLHARRPDLCWCDMVDAILLQNPRDYDRRYKYGDLCSVPLLSDADPFVPGRCYCSPAPVPVSQETP